jgi:hypothetical protein
MKILVSILAITAAAGAVLAVSSALVLGKYDTVTDTRATANLCARCRHAD